MRNDGYFKEIEPKKLADIHAIEDVETYLEGVTLAALLKQLTGKGITQKAFAESIGMNPRHLSAIKSSELKNRYFNELGAVKLCAVVRTDGIATGGGRRSRQMTPRRTTYLDPKGRGDKSMLVKREVSEDVYDAGLQRLRDKAKADCLNPNVQWWNRTLVGTTSDTGAIGSHRIKFRRWYALLDGTMRSERIEGHEWGA